MPATATAAKKPKIDARAAANAAAAYFKELYPNVAAFGLEEVELSEDGSHWLITLSFEFLPSQSNRFFLPAPKMKFKVFTVDSKTGKVVAMKIRRLE
jgi:hypothetical protein